VKRRGHRKIAPEAYTFDAVRLKDAHAAVIWEYARLSAVLRKGFQGPRMLSPQRLETKFLTAIRVILGPDKFLEQPWVGVFERLQRDMPELREEPVAVQSSDYPIKLIQGAEVEQEPGHLVLKVDLAHSKGEIIEAVSRIYDYYRPGLPLSLEGRAQDWMARLTWLGWYRLRRAGYSYREIAALCPTDAGAAGNLESMERQIKRGVSKVPEIFHALFPFLRLRRPKRKRRSYL
jgi:hypothetical protein